MHFLQSSLHACLPACHVINCLDPGFWSRWAWLKHFHFLRLSSTSISPSSAKPQIPKSPPRDGAGRMKILLEIRLNKLPKIDPNRFLSVCYVWGKGSSRFGDGGSRNPTQSPSSLVFASVSAQSGTSIDNFPTWSLRLEAQAGGSSCAKLYKFWSHLGMGRSRVG